MRQARIPRQHFSDALKGGGFPLRTRWILACGMGASIGTVSSLTLSAMGWSAIWMNTLCVALALGFFQSCWALRRSAAQVILWTTATALGIFVMARPFRTALGFSPPASVWWVEVTGTILSGLGIGILQYLALRKGASRPWRWIPAVTIANFAGVVGSLIFGILLYPVLSLAPLGLSINLAVLAMSLAFGVIFGCVTSIPVISMLAPTVERKL